MPRKQMDRPPADTKCLYIKTHGGLGDLSWLYAKLCNVEYPLFLAISDENKSRPRRSGIFADHLPRVVGYHFDNSTFAAGGQDWPHPDDPCCAIDKTWRELNFKPNTERPYRLECNRWLEGGRRLENWLPDLPTTFHYDLDPPSGAPTVRLKKPYVVFHLAGWPDVPDEVWKAGVRLFTGLAHVYIVGGSYDYRPRVVSARMSRDDVTLLEDLAWVDLVNLISGADYVFGHASGFTALTDVIKRPGAVINPRSVPKLTGTWNSPQNPDLLYVDKLDDFESAISAAHGVMSKDSNFTWPASARRGHRLTVKDRDDPESPVKSTAASVLPRNILVACDGDHPDWIGSAALSGVYAHGQVVDSVVLVGCRPDSVAAVYKEANRSTRRPRVDPMLLADGYSGRHAAIDLAVVYSGKEPAVAYRLACDAWRRLTARGTLLVGGPSAKAATAAVASTLRVKPGTVDGADGWYFLNRRI